MKVFMKSMLGLFVAGLAFYGGYQEYSSYTEVSESDLLLPNIEALASGGEGGLTVECYCKSNDSRPTTCVVGGKGSYCGGDPCASHDGNCR